MEEGEARESVLSKSLSCNLLVLYSSMARARPVSANHGATAAGLARKRAVPQFRSRQKVYATDFFNTLLAKTGSGEVSGGLENSKAPSSSEDHLRLTMSRK